MSGTFTDMGGQGSGTVPINTANSNLIGAILSGDPETGGKTWVYTGLYHFEANDGQARTLTGEVWADGHISDSLDARVSIADQVALENPDNDLVSLTILDNGIETGLAWGKAADDDGDTIPTLTHNGINQSITTGDFLAVPADEVISPYDNVESQVTPINSSVDDFDVSWGIWDHNDIRVFVDTANPNTLSSNAPTRNVTWGIVAPAALADLTGQVSYIGSASCGTSANCIGLDSAGNDILNVDMSFMVDFSQSVGAISDGTLQVGTGPLGTWAVTFDGDVQGVFAQMKNIADDTAVSGAVTGVTGNIGGVFTGTGGSGFVGAFDLHSGSDFVQGMTLINQNNPL
jgi:hypothetical protein